MDVNDKIEKLMNFLDSPEGKKVMQEFANKRESSKLILESQIEGLRKSGKFSTLVESAIKKYNSDEYVNRWYKRGIEPPEDIFWFLFEYSKKWGRECWEDEWENIAGMFTTEFTFCEGYYFERLDGQGSAIKITKIDEI